MNNQKPAWATATVPSSLQSFAPTWVYLQWHHGTGMGAGVLADGGFLLDQSKYPDLPATWPTVKTRWGKAWAIDSLTFAVLATKTTWHTGQNTDPVDVPQYTPGAWSRLHILAYIGELERTAVLTLRSSASQDLGRALRRYIHGPLAAARRFRADLPACAFWLTVVPDARQQRGRNNKAEVTPPTIVLPGQEPEEVAAWLNANFIGQDLLDMLAGYGTELAYFLHNSTPFTIDNSGPEPDDTPRSPAPAAPPRNGHSHPPAPAYAGQAANQNQPTQPAPDAPSFAQCENGHLYDANLFDCPICEAEDAAEGAANRCNVCGQRWPHHAPGCSAGKAAPQAAGQKPNPATAYDPQADLETTARQYGLQDNDAIKRLIAAAVKNGQPATINAAKGNIKMFGETHATRRR